MGIYTCVIGKDSNQQLMLKFDESYMVLGALTKGKFYGS